MLADFGEDLCSLLLAILTTHSGNAIWWKKATYITTMVIRNLRVEYGHSTAKQTYENTTLSRLLATYEFRKQLPLVNCCMSVP